MKNYILLILILCGIGIIILYRPQIMSFFSKTSEPKILETRSFSCPGLEGFTFEYPVFKGWEFLAAKKTDPSACRIDLSSANIKAANESKINSGSPKLQFFPSIQVSQSNSFIPPLAVSANIKNPHSVYYLGDVINSFRGQPITEVNNSVEFYFDGKDVKIQLVLSDDEYGSGFNRKQFFQTVIESFRTFPENVSNGVNPEESKDSELESYGLKVGMEYSRAVGILRSQGFVVVLEGYQEIPEHPGIRCGSGVDAVCTALFLHAKNDGKREFLSIIVYLDKQSGKWLMLRVDTT